LPKSCWLLVQILREKIASVGIYLHIVRYFRGKMLYESDYQI
jgi:hypothetical protein